jgi:HEAT repeat protein
MRFPTAIIGIGLLLVLAGCGGPSPPLVVHGQPVEHWLAALKDRDGRLRQRAVEALGAVGPADPKVVPALAGVLKDRDPAVRSAAVLCLLRLGPAAREAVPALEKAARKDRDRQVRTYAAQALARIRAEADE